MHAIDTPGAINGAFSEGNPAVGQRATKVGAPWLNDVQANLLAILAEAGLAPTKGRAADLVDAIKAIAAGSAGAGGGSVPTGRRIDTAGLATGGGTLTADRTITVPRASPAEVVAGTRDDVAMTPLAYAQAIAGSIGEGSATIGPLTFKRGSVIGSYGQGPVYVAFPAPFPVECWGAIPVVRNDSGSGGADFMAQLVGAPTKDGFTVMLNDGAGGNVHAVAGFNWLAMGR